MQVRNCSKRTIEAYLYWIQYFIVLCGRQHSETWGFLISSVSSSSWQWEGCHTGRGEQPPQSSVGGLDRKAGNGLL
ncbi:phage integrase N-terminal SAM-like domain-containing protein [Porticoccus sp.]|uniref:phage integrase N-terminal SAM-like domain-containing protein n=1 Tax=Porticoccus sp. TaxID=2024853 RepID=UPI0039E52A7E